MRSGRMRWGLLGTGRMASRFARDLKAAGIPVVAAAARDGDKARAFAAAEGIRTYHAGYLSLLEDPEVDAVHLSLPNRLHAEWSVRAAEAGKHVLCEKPGALDGAECARVLAAARRAGVLYMEGFMYRCHPLWDLAGALLAEGRIGPLRRLESAFRYDMGDKPEENRLSPERAGGALLDVGCYCLSFTLMMAAAAAESDRALAARPVDVEARSEIGPSGVDEATAARLIFPGGLTADFTCAIRRTPKVGAVIHGAAGRIEIASPWHPDPDRAEIRLVIPGEPDEVYRAGDGLSLFAREARLAEEWADKGECPAVPWEASRLQADVLGALRRSAGHA